MLLVVGEQRPTQSEQLLHSLVRDPGRAMRKTIDWRETRRLIAAGAQLVEMLPAAEYAEAHLPGALNIPLEELDREGVAQLDPTRPLIVYCLDYQ